ncbi:terminase large subunit domain-containing protein [Cerasicoccus maritimus]|uniref:phage terminase large subunit family protein n=1 Tax=Cerasicoccus maritimus TaxID=490089 RepID=UPI0028527FAA|nr:terminase family protein [Cerasicoccus maritimus]
MSFFLPYQQRWIADPAPFKIMEKSRQVGISWASAYACVRRAARHGQRLDTWVSSRDAIQAQLFLEDCRAFADTLNLAATQLVAPLLPGKNSANNQTLRFATGPRIHSLTSNPDAQAGKRGARVLDEFALHRNPRQLYAIAAPGLTWGGQLEIISTHRGAQNYFNELVNEARHGGNPKGISLHRVTLEDALDQGFLARLKTKLPADDPRQQMDDADYFNFVRQSCTDEETFLQEYCCVPADDQSSFLPWDLIAAAEYSEQDTWELDLLTLKIGSRKSEIENQKSEIRPPSSEHRPPNTVHRDSVFYLGVDIGRDHDLSVFWLVEAIGDQTLSRKVICLRDTPFAEQEATLDSLMRLPGLRRACIDQTGLGRQFAERARERYGRYRIEGVTFTPALKESLAYPLRSALEERRVKIPHCKDIRADLRAIKKEATTAGHIRFSADRGPSGHADRFWALALALHASTKTKPRLHLQRIQLSRPY